MQLIELTTYLTEISNIYIYHHVEHVLNYDQIPKLK